MPRLIWLPRIFAAVFFAGQCFIGASILARPYLGEAWPGLFRDWAEPLRGMQAQPPAAALTVRHVLDGTYQTAAAGWVAANLPQRAAVVRAYNEVMWRGFGTSYMANRELVRGKSGALYEKGYVLAHCGILASTDLKALPAFARRLRAAQDWFRTRGQYAIYMLAPVKTSWFPDDAPGRFDCPAARRDPARGPALAALDAAGVHYVDARAVLETTRQQVPVELFPRNGTHWNDLGAVLGARALVESLRAMGLGTLPVPSYGLIVEADETGFDRDLSNLLNLLVPPPGNRSPRVTMTSAGTAEAPRLVAINDSFFALPAYQLTIAGVFRSAVLFEYLTLNQRRYEGATVTFITAPEPEIVHDILTAEVVVLEEIESRVGGPYARRFLDLVEREMARAAEETVKAPP